MEAQDWPPPKDNLPPVAGRVYNAVCSERDDLRAKVKLREDERDHAEYYRYLAEGQVRRLTAECEAVPGLIEEVELLRAELSSAKLKHKEDAAQIVDLMHERDSISAEVKRLRAALEKIDREGMNSSGWWCHVVAAEALRGEEVKP